MFCFCIRVPLLIIYVLCFSVQNVHILNDIFPILAKAESLATLRRYALIFDHNCLKFV